MFREKTSPSTLERQQISAGAAVSQSSDSFLEERIAAIKALCARGGPEPEQYATLASWFASVGQARAEGRLSHQDLGRLRAAFGPAMSAATMQGRSLLQKYGYAGDFEIIDEIYCNVVSEEPALAAWDRFYHAQGAPKAVRNRKTYFKQLVREALAANPQGIGVLNVASGPCRDIAEFFKETPEANVQFTCVDIDERAIVYAKDVCGRWLDRMTFVRSNALRLRLDKRFDLVWSAGLFDYFDDRGFKVLLAKLMKHAAPGFGQVVVGNFVNPSPSAVMQEFSDWFLEYRTEDQLVELATACGVSPDAIQVDREPEGINLFLRICLRQRAI